MWCRGSSPGLIPRWPACAGQGTPQPLHSQLASIWDYLGVWFFSSPSLFDLVFEAFGWLFFLLFVHSFHRQKYLGALLCAGSAGRTSAPLVCVVGYACFSCRQFWRSDASASLFLPKEMFYKKWSDWNFQGLLLVLNSVKTGITSCSSYKPIPVFNGCVAGALAVTWCVVFYLNCSAFLWGMQLILVAVIVNANDYF